MPSLSDSAYPGNAPPAALATPGGGVRLWWCATDTGRPAEAALRGWLSAAELARAARFGTPALAARYVSGRAALRFVLANLLGCAPAAVPIARSPRGRPFVAAPGAPDFNVSNTRQVALIGVVTATGTRIGVDVEHRERRLAYAGLARKFCTPRERAAFAASDDEDHARQRFLRLWTCKEAMSKATGDALAAPLRELDVELEPALRLAGGPPPYLPGDWTLLDAPVPADYVATVALWRSGTGEPA